jgi:drug/metabolite transporter (DMT)-like permease
VLFGVSAPLASRLAGDMGAFTLAGLLYLGAALAVVPVAGHAVPSRQAVRRSIRRLGVAVVVGGAVGPVLFATGLADAPAATASLLLNLELVFTTIVAAVFFREHVDARVVTGTSLVVIAGLLLGWSGSAELRWGALLIAAACLCWAVDNSVTAALDELSPSHITLAKGVIAGGANLAIGLSIAPSPDVAGAIAALAVGAFGYGLSITLWVAGARELGAARAQLVFATAPFIGAAVAWTVLGDAATGSQIGSLAIALVGVSFVLGSDHEHKHAHEAVEHDHEHIHGEGHHEHDHDGARAVRHSHRHVHAPLLHRHGHVPDLHHRHDHETGGTQV